MTLRWLILLFPVAVVAHAQDETLRESSSRNTTRRIDTFPPHAAFLLEGDRLKTPIISGEALCPGLPEEHPLRATLEPLLAPPTEDAVEPPAPETREEPGTDTAPKNDAAADSPPTSDEAAEVTAPPLPALEQALLDARHAVDPRDQRWARRRLRAMLDQSPASDTTACVRLELSRLELRMHLFPEASASALAARPDDPRTNLALAEAAEFVRGEALYQSDSPERAGPVFLSVSKSTHPETAAVSRLRLADIRFDSGARSSTFDTYQRTLLPAAPFGIDPQLWEPRFIEAAIASREYSIAERIFRALLRTSPPKADGLRLRLADVLAAQRRDDEASKLLHELAAKNDPSPMATLARLRLFEWGLEEAEAGAAIDDLRRELANADSSRLRIYGELLLARRQIERGPGFAPLQRLLTIALEPAFPEMAGTARALLDLALQSATNDFQPETGCIRLIDGVAGRGALMLRQSETPEPFLYLASCFERFGLPQAAHDVYRELARRFGAEVVTQVALPIARTALATGQIEDALAAAELQTSRTAEDLGWRKLVAASELARDDARAALAALKDIEPDVAALALIVRAIEQSANGPPGQRLQRDLLDPAIAGPSDTLGAAQLLAADLTRKSGNPADASDLYAAAASSLASGPLDAEARYWNARLTGTAPSSEAVANQLAFSRLADEQYRLETLQRRIGLGKARR